MPGTFQECIDALEENPLACGAYTDEVLINTVRKLVEPELWSGKAWNPLLQLVPKYLHHLFVMRRVFVLPQLDELEKKCPHLMEYVLKGLFCTHGMYPQGLSGDGSSHGPQAHYPHPVSGCPQIPGKNPTG